MVYSEEDEEEKGGGEGRGGGQEEQEEEGLFKANAVNEEDPERGRTQMYENFNLDEDDCSVCEMKPLF